MAQGLLRGEDPNKNLFNYLRNAEGWESAGYLDVGSNRPTRGYGVAITPENTQLYQGLLSREAGGEALKISMQEHKERAREVFNKDIRRHHTTGGPTKIPFDKQPPKVQELLTELEFNGGLSGWPELMKNAKKGDYKGVEKEMYLSVEKAKEKGLEEGTKRRNRLRREYFAKDIKALPKLRLADAYGTVEPDEEHSLWPDLSDFGLPKHPIDYLFGNDRQQQEQPTPQQAGHMGFAMEGFGGPQILGGSTPLSVESIYNKHLPQRPSPQQQYEAARMNRPPLAPPLQQMQQQQQMQQPQQPTLQQQAQTAQVQPALDPFPWLRETYDRRSKVGMYPEKKKFKSRSMYPQPKNF